MMSHRDDSGYGLVEVLIAMAVLVMVMSGLAGVLLHSSRLNRTQQMTAQAQADARNCLSIMVQKLRSAGWNPRDISFEAVTLDPDGLADGISQIEIRADLNDDGDLDDELEQLLIRQTDRRVEWRTDPDGDFEILAVNITNDADGDGLAEPMFVPDADPPTSITVRVTARSPRVDPATGEFIRYTVSSDVAMRTAL